MDTDLAAYFAESSDPMPSIDELAARRTVYLKSSPETGLLTVVLDRNSPDVVVPADLWPGRMMPSGAIIYAVQNVPASVAVAHVAKLANETAWAPCSQTHRQGYRAQYSELGAGKIVRPYGGE